MINVPSGAGGDGTGVCGGNGCSTGVGAGGIEHSDESLVSKLSSKMDAPIISRLSIFFLFLHDNSPPGHTFPLPKPFPVRCVIFPDNIESLLTF